MITVRFKSLTDNRNPEESDRTPQWQRPRPLLSCCSAILLAGFLPPYPRWLFLPARRRKSRTEGMCSAIKHTFQKSCTPLLLTSHGPELSHMATPHCNGGQIILTLFPVAIYPTETQGFYH